SRSGMALAPARRSDDGADLSRTGAGVVVGTSRWDQGRRRRTRGGAALGTADRERRPRERMRAVRLALGADCRGDGRALQGRQQELGIWNLEFGIGNWEFAITNSQF